MIRGFITAYARAVPQETGTSMAGGTSSTRIAKPVAIATIALKIEAPHGGLKSLAITSMPR